MPTFDRRQIAPLLADYFPGMGQATSEEWHGFLNAMTGLDIEIGEPNSTAFDKWRQALTEQGKADVWGISTAQAHRIRERGEEMKRLEDARVKALPETLAELAKAAPTKTAEQLIADTKAANE